MDDFAWNFHGQMCFDSSKTGMFYLSLSFMLNEFRSGSSKTGMFYLSLSFMLNEFHLNMLFTLLFLNSVLFHLSDYFKLQVNSQL